MDQSFIKGFEKTASTRWKKELIKKLFGKGTNLRPKDLPVKNPRQGKPGVWYDYMRTRGHKINTRGKKRGHYNLERMKQDYDKPQLDSLRRKNKHIKGYLSGDKRKTMSALRRKMREEN